MLQPRYSRFFGRTCHAPHLLLTSTTTTRRRRAMVVQAAAAVAGAAAPGSSRPLKLLVVANPAAPELSVLQRLPPNVHVVATGQTLADLSQQLTSDAAWASVEVVLNCGVGKFAGRRDDIQVSRCTRSPARPHQTELAPMRAATFTLPPNTPRPPPPRPPPPSSLTRVMCHGPHSCRSFGRA